MSVSEREQARKKLLQKVAVVAAGLLLLTGILLIIFYWEGQQDTFPSITDGTDGSSGNNRDPNARPIEDGRQTARYNGQWYVMRENIETVLVIGLDTADNTDPDKHETFENDARADFLMLLIIDRNNETIRALHINRDTMADIPVLGVGGQVIGTTNAQLALAHTYGSGRMDSCINTATAVSVYLYDTPIDHYVSLDMAAIQIVNDAVGGVTLTVLDDFSGIDDSLVKGETVTLMGEHAMRYVRSRGGMEDSTNEHRMIRQRQYLGALHKQTKDRISSDVGFALGLLLGVSEHLVSDCTIYELSDLLQISEQYEFSEIETIAGESIVGDRYMEFYADEDELQKQIIELFYEPEQ